MEKLKKKSKVWLCIALALMLLSMIVASSIQTSGGDVKIKSLKFETDEGYSMSANLFVPKTATAENPAPAIVSSHGAFNNKEMQDANAIELSRRGFVVIAIDQPAHGNTEVVSGSAGVYQGVLALSRLPYVDVTRIGITGHSMGGMSCNNAIAQDNTNEVPLVSAVLLNCADATYTDTTDTSLSDTKSTAYANVFGNRDVGIIACQYDEFFHKSTDANGNPLSAYYFMETPEAQSFLNFGKDPTGLPTREAYTIYTEEVDGESCIRVIYRPDIIHPWSHFSAKSTSYTIQFFSDTLGAPKAIDEGNQVWRAKEFFNFIGMLGLVIFIANFAVLMLFTPKFADLRAEKELEPVETNKTGKLWFWISLAVAALFSMVVYLPLTTIGMTTTIKQQQSFAIGLWAAGCGLFAILSMVVYYFAYGKKNGFNLEERGVKLSAKKLGKTVILAIIVACVAISTVFFADYFFKTDFRLWTLALKTFDADKIKIALFPYLWLFLIYYVASSVSFNSFNFVKLGKSGKSWVNSVVIALFAAIPSIVMLAVQYGTYFAQKHLFWAQSSFAGGNPPMYVLWHFPMVFILPAAALISRKVYKASNNPYLAGIVNGIIVTIMTVTNTRCMF